MRGVGRPDIRKNSCRFCRFYVLLRRNAPSERNSRRAMPTNTYASFNIPSRLPLVSCNFLPHFLTFEISTLHAIFLLLPLPRRIWSYLMISISIVLIRQSFFYLFFICCVNGLLHDLKNLYRNKLEVTNSVSVPIIYLHCIYEIAIFLKI